MRKYPLILVCNVYILKRESGYKKTNHSMRNVIVYEESLRGKNTNQNIIILIKLKYPVSLMVWDFALN